MVFLHAPINYRSGLRDMDLHMDLLDDAFTSYSCMMIMCNAGGSTCSGFCGGCNGDVELWFPS